MKGFCCGLSRNKIYSLCLVTATIWTILLVFQIITRVKLKSTSPTAINATLRSQYRRLEHEVTFATSPYNAHNKRGPIAKARPNSEPKVIYWQALETIHMVSKQSGMFEGCPVSSCVVSPFENAYQYGHAGVFDDEGTNRQTHPTLKENRVLVYYNMGMPGREPSNKEPIQLSKYWKSSINWVWSFRLDSDIFEPYAYLKKNSKPESIDTFAEVVQSKSTVAVWIDPKTVKRGNELADLDRNLQKHKSHADVEEFTKRLSQEMSFDTMSVLDLRAALDDSSLSKYYFVLAFEWANCAEYVTDLFFTAFDPRVLAVPVVRGGFNYTQHFPKGTFVNADDFKSPTELARYLEKLAADTDSYTQMLWKKSQYVSEEGRTHAWCQLCEMLHRVDEDKQLLERYYDVHAWFNEGGGCNASNAR